MRFSEKNLLENAFKECKTPESEQTPFWTLEQPPSMEQAICFLKSCTKVLGILKPEGIYDVEKISQQFVDYGYKVPDDINTIENINIHANPALFVDRAFAFFKSNIDAIRAIYYLDPKHDS